MPWALHGKALGCLHEIPALSKLREHRRAWWGQQDPKEGGKGEITTEPHLVSVLLGGLEVLGLMGSIHSSLHSSSLFWPGCCGDLQEKSTAEGM